MFSGWFSETAGGADSKKDLFRDDKNEPMRDLRQRSSSHSVGPQHSHLPTSSEPRTCHSSSVISPHDLAVSQMTQELHEIRLADPASGVTGLPHSVPDPVVADEPQKPVPTMTRSRALPENMYDPFDGQSIGAMVPGEFEQAEDELWTHLAHIRELQSEIARMHSQMEGLGESERMHRSEQTVDDETVNVEEEVKAAKAAEFAKLADRFNGRKDAIDAIMLKLESLSHAINDFHSSRAPVFRFASTRWRLSDQQKVATKPVYGDGLNSPS